MKTYVRLWPYLTQFYLDWEIFQTKFVEKIKSHRCSAIFFFRKSFRVWHNVEKYRRAGQATVDNMAHAHCMLDTKVYKRIHSGYVIFFDFPLQKWSHERASM